MWKICSNNKSVDFEQIQLFNKTFNTDITKAKWEKKHFQNPYLERSENICMYKDDKLIGFNMFMPQIYIVDNDEMIFLQSCESVVEENERGNGYLSKLLSYSEQLLNDKYSVIYGIPNHKSKPIFDKLGYKEKFALDRMMKFGCIKNILSDILHNNKKSQFESKKTSVKSSDKMIDEIESMHEIKSSSIKIKKNRLLYEWKIDENKNLFIRYLYTKNTQGEITAYCIVSFSLQSKIRRAVILDFYIKKGKEKDFKDIVNEIKRNVSIILVTIASTSSEQKQLISAGFRVQHKHVTYLVYKVITDNKKLTSILEREKWAYSPIEADTILN